LLLIRHGDYVIYAPTAEGKRLTPCGKTQANQTARTLVSTHTCDIPLVEEIITSTMVRARETENIIDT
jgi:phosphohistidine phosphatase SixA